jgi:DNA-binding LacI/PurR family transcriptional regulator
LTEDVVATERVRRVTAADVARALGVSRATVGFVFNETPGVSEATRRRVIEGAARLGYRPHTTAQALARGSSRLVLFVLPEWPMDFRLRRHLAETELELDRAGYSMVTYTPHPGGRSRRLWEVLQPDVVVGLTPFDADTLAAIRACGITRIVPGEAHTGSLAGLPFQQEGPRLQVEHLVERGHRVLGVATSADPRLAELAQVRTDAALTRAEELGLPVPLVRRIGLEDAADGPGPVAVREWRAAGVTAVVAYNDDVAAAVAGAALRLGFAVPADLAVVGHDATPLARLFVPRLTSVAVDVPGIGRYIAELALATATDGPEPEALGEASTYVVAGEST